METNAYGMTAAATATLRPLPADDGCCVPAAEDDLLESLWTELARQLYGIARAMGLDTAASEDVVQDVYLTAMQKRPSGMGSEQLRRWLLRVTVNQCNLAHRRRRRWEALLGGLVNLWPAAGRSGDRADRHVCQEETARLVREALRGLSAELRAVFVLRYYAQFDAAEIGRILNLPHSTVRSHLRKGRIELAKRLRQIGYEYE